MCGEVPPAIAQTVSLGEFCARSTTGIRIAGSADISQEVHETYHEFRLAVLCMET